MSYAAFNENTGMRESEWWPTMVGAVVDATGVERPVMLREPASGLAAGRVFIVWIEDAYCRVWILTKAEARALELG